MKQFAALGWFVALLVLAYSTTIAVAAPSPNDPLEGHLLQDSGATVFVYLAGEKLEVDVAPMTNNVIDAIPTAQQTLRRALLDAGITGVPLLPSRNPDPFPGYS